MTKVYKITVAELIVLKEIMAEYGRELGCCQGQDDLCGHCQRLYDLRQKIINAQSLAEVGCNVIFTTADELISEDESAGVKKTSKPSVQ